jgi:hypothetical protein
MRHLEPECQGHPGRRRRHPGRLPGRADGPSVGELIEGTATLTTEQDSDVIKALQDAIDVVEDAP